MDVSMKNVVISWAIEIIYDENTYSKLKGDSHQYFIFDAEKDLEAISDSD